MTNKTIHTTGTLRTVIGTDEIEVQATGGGASAHIVASDFVPASGLSAALAALGLVANQLGTVETGQPYTKWDDTAKAFLVTLPPPETTAQSAELFTPVLAADGAGNLSNGVYSYKFTYVTTNGETSPSAATPTVTVTDHTANGKVKVWWPWPVDANLTKTVRIYRTVANGAVWKLHSELNTSDNPAVAIVDNIADASLGANAPTTNTAIEPAFRFAGDGGIQPIHSAAYDQDVVTLVPSLPGRGIILQAQPGQGFGSALTIYGGGAAYGQGGGLTLNGGDVYGEDRIGLDAIYGGDVNIKGGFAAPVLDGATGYGGNVILQPGDAPPNEGPGIGIYGEIRLKDAGGTIRLKVDKDGYLVVSVPSSSSGLPSGGLYTTAGAMMVKA